MLSSADDFDVELIRDVLDATHQEGRSPTVYSNIFDLVSGKIYLYNVHNFSEVVTLDFKEELAKGKYTIALPSLFAD
jgi:hypothetical protein